MPDVTLSFSGEILPWYPSEERIRTIVECVFLGEEKPFESIGVIFCDHGTLHAMNREWLEHDWTTDVISFLLEEDPIEGEIYIDVETAQERHAEFDSTLTTEIERYAVRGLLHLCGHDDASDKQRAAMQVLEDHYLSQLN